MHPHDKDLQTLALRLAELKSSTVAEVRDARSDLNRSATSWTSEARLAAALGDLNSASKGVGDAATKLVLVLQNPATKAVGAASICSEFGHVNEVLVTALAIVGQRGPGTPLWIEATHAVAALVAGSADLAVVVAASTPSDAGGGGKKKGGKKKSNSSAAAKDEAAAARACGVVLNIVETKFKQLPKSNRAAYRRAVMAASSLVKETFEEFQHIVDAGPAAPRTEGGEEPGGVGGVVALQDDLDDFDFFSGDLESDLDGDDDGGEQYSASELPVATAALACLGLMRPTLKTTLDALDVAAEVPTKAAPASQAAGGAAATAAASAAQADSGSLGSVARAYRLSKAAADLCTGLGAALYPPLDLDEVRGAASPLAAAAAALGAALADIANAADKASSEEPTEGGTPVSLEVPPRPAAAAADAGPTPAVPAPPVPAKHTGLRRVNAAWVAAIAGLGESLAGR